ncbi:MAG: S8 family serine peptidase [Clostridium fessum]
MENCVYGFRDFLKKKQQPYDDNGHGTHVAGMIAGSGTASAGRYQGVGAGGAAGLPESAGSEGNGYVSDVLAGLRWVRQNGSQYGIRIINISVGSFTPKGMSEDSALVRGVDAAWDAGYVVVVAAGNNGPAAHTITTPRDQPEGHHGGMCG